MDRHLPLDPYTLAPVNEPWRNRATGVKGHAVRHQNFTDVSEEVLAVIEHLGLVPDAENLTQLETALFDIWLATPVARGPVVLATEAQVRDALGDGAVQAKWLNLYARRLTADLHLYVRSDGNDANTGLADTAGGAFRQIQRAIDVSAGRFVGGPYKIIVHVGTGSFARISVDNLPMLIFDIQGQGAATVIDAAGIVEECVQSSGGSTVFVRNLKLLQGLHQLYATDRARIDFDGVIFSKCSKYLALSAQGSSINAVGPFSIEGDGTTTAEAAMVATINSTVNLSGQALTNIGVGPIYTTAFTWANNATVLAKDFTHTGATVGPRYFADLGGLVAPNGGGATFFPGNAPGTVATGGLYY